MKIKKIKINKFTQFHPLKNRLIQQREIVLGRCLIVHLINSKILNFKINSNSNNNFFLISKTKKIKFKEKVFNN